MALIFAVLASVLLGAGITAYFLISRWKQIIADAKHDLTEMAEQYKATQEENRELKQKVADLQYQFNSVQKDLNFAREQAKNDDV
ncbi:hypothetical protein [Thalassolituus sp.]|jgi:cell division protein FtsB|uniref:hypothetical protein n=1 Tax=Thalassolituus sp. TaxID=2030822 RepID=UPI002A821851|nr:hypothetical protein [Thalassolituus sp.]|tara:strand:- start:626 stop:880 length:255 start_codon:yes stop_codon:yes gene_type:complete